MSYTLTRVVLTVALLFAIPAVWVQILMVLDRWCRWRSATDFAVTTLAVGTLTALAYLLIWYRCVRWTRRRVVATLIMAAVASVFAFVVYLVHAALWDDEGAMILAGLLGECAWVAGTALVWRETRVERALRTEAPGHPSLSCPQCGYNLRGLHEARCPECGTQYTLDELFAHLSERPGTLE